MTVYDPPPEGPSISVGALLEDPGLSLNSTVIAGKRGLDRIINHPRIQKSGLVLVGHLHGLVPTRIQVLGETELSYAYALDDDAKRRAAEFMFAQPLSCVVVTRGVKPPPPFVEEAERTGTPLVVCTERSSSAITALHTLLDERLAPRKRIHGVLVDVFEVGVLLLGKSGIGKSECALELVMRGHRLVADDVIECDYRPPGMVFGEAAGQLRHHIEVRGLGIINILDLYGVTSIRERKRIDVVTQLDLWEEGREYDRLGVEDRIHEILGVPIREYIIPVRPGRNMSAIIEIAARHELLKQSGHDPSKEFIEALEKAAGAGRDELEEPKLPPSQVPPGPAESSPYQPVVQSRHRPRAATPRANESAVPPPVIPKGRR